MKMNDKTFNIDKCLNIDDLNADKLSNLDPKDLDIIKKGVNIKADCIGKIKEKTSPKNITITVSYFKKNGR